MILFRGMPLDLSTTVDESSQAVVLTVLGEVDLATIDELESKIESLEDTSSSLVIDLTSTEFMDSTGLRLLIATHERLRDAGRELKVAVDGGPIGRLLEVTGVLTHLNVFSSVGQALES
jgi:anti-sigma B factor antagonist